MVERHVRDLEVRVRVPVQVQIFLLKYDEIFVFIMPNSCILKVFDSRFTAGRGENMTYFIFLHYFIEPLYRTMYISMWCNT